MRLQKKKGEERLVVSRSDRFSQSFDMTRSSLRLSHIVRAAGTIKIKAVKVVQMMFMLS